MNRRRDASRWVVVISVGSRVPIPGRRPTRPRPVPLQRGWEVSWESTTAFPLEYVPVRAAAAPRGGGRRLDLECLGFDLGPFDCARSRAAGGTGDAGSLSRRCAVRRRSRDQPPGRRPPLGEAKQRAGIAPGIAVQLFERVIGGIVILTRRMPAARVLRRDRGAGGEDGHASWRQSPPKPRVANARTSSVSPRTTRAANPPGRPD